MCSHDVTRLLKKCWKSVLKCWIIPASLQTEARPPAPIHPITAHNDTEYNVHLDEQHYVKWQWVHYRVSDESAG